MNGVKETIIKQTMIVRENIEGQMLGKMVV